jgi:adenylate kinase
MPGSRFLRRSEVHANSPVSTVSELNLILFGPPGAGKGTQAERLQEDFALAYIATGDILRKAVAEGTDLGQRAKEYMDRGELVPDDIIIGVILEEVSGDAAQDGFLLDGFPRTVEQAEAAYEVAGEKGVNVQLALHIDVPTEEVVRRLLARGRGTDDTEEVIAHRMEVYREKTVPLLDYYTKREKLVHVNGARPVGEVAWSIAVQLQRIRL